MPLSVRPAAAASGEKVLVLGASGLLGTSVAPLLAEGGHRIECHGRSGAAAHRADLADAGQTMRLLGAVRPAVIVNMVGLTDVDQCEARPQAAYLGNVRTVENIAGWIRTGQTPCHLVQLSTDHVYSAPGVHGEGEVELTNCYAFSKYAGELAAQAVPCTILRTNFFGRGRGTRASLTDWLFSALAKRESIQVFDDVRFSPVSMATLAAMIDLVIRTKPVGLFNLGSHTGMSKADFAFCFAEELRLSTAAVARGSVDGAASLKARRPKDMRMDSARFEAQLGVRLPELRDEIRRVAKDYHDAA
jgi:dTDP-4-dehydrorhamnose reductase